MEPGQRTQAVFAPPTVRSRIGRRLTGARRALRNNPTMTMGFIIMVAAIVMAIFAPLIATHDPHKLAVFDRLNSPSSEHFFGTDSVGRDVYSRAIYGSRLSLQIGAAVGAIAVFWGAVIGILSGYYRKFDNIAMRVVDGLMAFPSFLLALALVAILGPSLQNVIIAISLVDTPGVVRIVRSSVLSLKEQMFVEAARAIGARPERILIRHVFPQLVAPLLVQGTFIFAIAILTEAGLSFLGTGVPPIIPSWGNMMGESKIYVQLAVWTIFFPGLFISLTVLGMNLIGDGLRDTLDPRLRRTV